jgi:hypothetical protein
MAGTVMGAIKVAFPIGGIVTPFFMSIISSALSLQAAVLILPLSMALGFALMLPVIGEYEPAAAGA